MKNSWLVLIDAKTGTAQEVAKAIHTVRELDDLAQHNWRTLMSSSVRMRQRGHPAQNYVRIFNYGCCRLEAGATVPPV